MLPGFNRIVEERIRMAQLKGEFENLQGKGRPLVLDDDSAIPEDLRLAYKILKNADCIPREIELKKDICRTEEMLSGVEDAEEKYRLIKKLNLLIKNLNTSRGSPVNLEIPERYAEAVTSRMDRRKS